MTPGSPGATGASPDAVPAELDRGLLALSTRRPVSMLMVVATVVVFGLISFFQLPRNLMPDISYPTITVRTEYPGAAPIDVEDRISERLEGVLSQVRSLRRISSISRAEISEIILEFAWGTNMGQATLEVREKIEQAILPDDVERPVILRYDPTLDPILQLGFFRVASRSGGSGLDAGEPVGDLIDLRIEAEELIEKSLELVPGVAAVEVRGGYEKEIRVDVDEALLPSRKVTMEMISQRLREENLNLASGILYDSEQAYIVRSVNEFQDLDEIRDIVLRRDGEIPVRLRDVATVEFGFKDPEVLTRYNGNPCVKIDVYKEADANIVQVARRVKDRIFGTPAERERLRAFNEQERKDWAERRRREAAGEGASGTPGTKKEAGKAAPSGGGAPMIQRPSYLTARLDEDRDIVVMSDQAVFIRNSLDEVRSTAVFGGILATLVIYFFLRNVLFTSIVALAIPLSVIATFATMKILGVSLNIMSLGGLALGVGMLVDNSIVVLESIFRCRQEGDAPRLAAVRGGRSVAAAVTASTLTTVAVFFPIVFVEGIAGQIFRDQALTVVISLVASLAVSLTFIPTLVSLQLGGVRSPEGGWIGSPRRPLDRAHLRELLFLEGPVWQALSRWPWRLLRWAPVLLGLFNLSLELAGRASRSLLARAALLLRRVTGGTSRRLGAATARFLGIFDAAWHALDDVYPRVVAAALRSRPLVLSLALLLGGASLYLISKLGAELIPEVHQGEFTVEVGLPVGTRIQKTDQVMRPLERKAGRVEGVLSVASTIGVELDSARAGEEGEHTARMLVRVGGGRSPVELEEQVKAALREIVGEVPEVVSDRIRNPVLFSFKTPIEVEVKGYNLQQLKRVAEQVEERMRAIPSIKDVKSTMRPGYPEVHLHFDRELLVRSGLEIGVIGDAIRRKIEGDVATRFTEGDRKVDLRVRLRQEDRTSLQELENIVVNPGSEKKLLLRDVAEVVKSEGPAEIRRIGQIRSAVISANLAGLDLGRATRSIAASLEGLRMPAGFDVGFGGQQQEMHASRQSLLRALALAIFLVYVVMAAQFESLVQPLIILFAIPLAAVGIAPVLWALDVPLSVIVLIGMIILAGIVVNNAIVLIDCINQLRRSGMSKVEAIIRGGNLRLRPILMTTLTTVLGLLPLTGALNALPGIGPIFAWLLGAGEGLEIRAPMALTVISGLLASTVLTLVVIPVVYSLSDTRD